MRTSRSWGSGPAQATVALAALLAIGGATLATGAIPSPDGSVDACIANADRSSNTGLLGPTVKLDRRGTLRAIDSDAGQQCAGDEKPLTFSVKGPPGPAGPQGPTGPGGPQGEPATDLWAVVDPNGEILSESGVASVELLPFQSNIPRHYLVQFDRDISQCAAIATIGSNHLGVPLTRVASTSRSTGGGTHVSVYLAEPGGPQGELGAFSLAMFC